MDSEDYMIGCGKSLSGEWLAIGYRELAIGYRGVMGPGPEIIYQLGDGPASESTALPPKRMLDFIYSHSKWENRGGQPVFIGVVPEPPGWFERKCREANCEWFIPMVKRMAAGENVALEEIEAGYFARNGKPMPRGTWPRLCDVYYQKG